MKSRWLNLMLHFSGVINRYKLKVIETTGPKIVFYGFSVLVLEIANLGLALPAYAFISSKEFAGSDTSAIRTYRLRRIASLSVIAGMVISLFVWILVSFFGLVLFPGKSHAAVASWDFNTPLAYNYDTTKIQIVDGNAMFKASQTISPTTPTQTEGQVGAPTENVGAETPPVDTTTDTVLPATEPAPTTETVTPTTDVSGQAEPPPAGGSEPVVEPTPAPVVEPTPAPTPDPVPASPLLFDTFDDAPRRSVSTLSLIEWVDNLRKLFKPQVSFAQANSCSAILQTITPLVVTPFVKWTGFSETANKNGGEIYYILSGDGGLSWLYWNGSNWADAGTNKGNTYD